MADDGDPIPDDDFFVPDSEDEEIPEPDKKEDWDPEDYESDESDWNPFEGGAADDDLLDRPEVDAPSKGRWYPDYY